MTQKKKKTKPRQKKKANRKSKEASFLLPLRQFVITVGVVVAGLFIALYILDYLYPENPNTSSPRKQLSQLFSFRTNDSFQFPGEKAVSSAKGNHPAATKETRVEMPALRTTQKEQVIHHEGYTVSYNSDYKIANWVAWELTREEAVSNKVPRHNRFVPDPEVKGATALHEDYSNTGFDRGHLAPAADMKWSEKAMRETFYLSNICPQHPKLNQGIWNTLENKCRQWAKVHGTLWIATGPVITSGMRVMGKNRIGVPDRFYKVICCRQNNKYRSIAFLLESKDYGKTSLTTLAIPVDSVEKVSGIDFFHQLPEQVQQEMESAVDLSFWF